MSVAEDLQPITIYGSNISYFTGKLEMYFRAKGIEYQLKPMTWRLFNKEIPAQTGVVQMPAVQLGDGRWMTDTTPIIDWFETHYPENRVTPVDGVKRFYCRLLEDYADEWLWRPAMHYRWHTDEGAMFASRHLCEELMTDHPAPGFIKRAMLRRRQRGYTRGDGIRDHNINAVEKTYHDNLAALQANLEKRPFLLGGRPSLVDIAFCGPMFRHFYQDPVPAEIMRETAPAVVEWIARLWNYKPGDNRVGFLPAMPEGWNFWLKDIGATYLPYLNANAKAIAAGKERFAAEVGGAKYENAHASRYRVWCLEQLRDQFQALPDEARNRVRTTLEKHGCWEPLWSSDHLDSGINTEGEQPFGGSGKMVH